MKFCTKCGGQIEDGKQFCIKCGQSASKQAEPAQSTSSEPSSIGKVNNQTANNPEAKLPTLNLKLSKPQKIMAIAVAVVLVLGVAFYKVGESLTSRDKIVSKLTQAIASNDSAQLSKYIVSSDPKLKIDAKSLDALLKYMDKVPSYGNEIIKSINNQSVKMEISPKLKGTSVDVFKNNEINNNLNDLFVLKKQGKTWFFYDKYVLDLKPVYIRVSTNYKDTQIFLGDTLVCTSTQNDFTKEIGPYTPGLYTMKATLKGQYINLEQTVEIDLVKDIDLSNPNQKVKDQQLFLDGYEVTVDSDYQDAKLFANGKDTGLLIQDAKAFGPVSKDGSVKLYAQKDFPWGTAKGKDVAVDGSSNIYLELNGLNDSLQVALMESINTYNKGWFDAFKSRDISKFTNVTEDKKNLLIADIQGLIDYKRMYTGTLSKTAFDLNSFSIYQSDNKYYAQLTNLETYNYAYFDEGVPIPTAILEEQAKVYTLIYDETSKKWLINDMYTNYNFNSENKKEFTF